MWAAFEEALVQGRPRDALRIAVALWRDVRDPDLAALVTTLAAFVDSDPRTAPPQAPDDPADLDGWLARVDEASRRIYEGDWWTRELQGDLVMLSGLYGQADDPRVAAAIETFLSEARNLGSRDPFAARLTQLRGVPKPLGEAERAIVTRGLARYRDEPQRLIDLVVDPSRERDDGTEEVASDALTEMGHPYGEAIALEYDAAAGVITAAGRERLATLIACHEQRWLGRTLFLSTKERVYRGGLLDAMVLRLGMRSDALLDPRLARLRTLRVDSHDFDATHAARFAESPWLGRLEELEVPSFELLAGMRHVTYPRLRVLRLGRLRAVTHSPDFAHWAQPLAEWCSVLPSLDELIFHVIPEDGLEVLIEMILSERLNDRIRTFSLDARFWSWIRSGEGDPTMWFRLLDRHAFRRAALYYSDASMTVQWTNDGLVVDLATSEGGAAFDLLPRLPDRPIARLVFHEFPGRRPKKLAGLGRLRRYLARAHARVVEMPVRWRNQLAELPEE